MDLGSVEEIQPLLSLCISRRPPQRAELRSADNSYHHRPRSTETHCDKLPASLRRSLSSVAQLKKFNLIVYHCASAPRGDSEARVTFLISAQRRERGEDRFFCSLFCGPLVRQLPSSDLRSSAQCRGVAAQSGAVAARCDHKAAHRTDCSRSRALRSACLRGARCRPVHRRPPLRSICRTRRRPRAACRRRTWRGRRLRAGRREG